MQLKQSLERRLTGARLMSEKFLTGFQTPEQWTHQVFPGANHALWFAGHLGVVDNFFLSLVEPGEAPAIPAGYWEKFGMGSQPTSRAEDYPSVEEVLAYMRSSREALMAALARLNDDDFDRPTPPGTPRRLPDVASVFEAAAWHEGMHAGQISVARRSLGHAPFLAG